MNVEITVLVTAIGSFSSSAVVPILKSNGFRVIGCDVYPREWVASSCEVDVFYQVPLASLGLDYIAAIKSIVDSEGVDLIVPLTDFEVDVLSPARKDLGAKLCVSNEKSVLCCRDKTETSKVVEGLYPDLVIPTFSASDFIADDLLSNGKWICKPINGRSSAGLFKAEDRRSALAYLETVDFNELIVQPMIDGFVVTVDVVRSPLTGRVVALPRKELLRTLNGAGTSVYVYRDEELEKRCAGIANALSISGCVNFEFIYDNNGSYHFLECNPRFAGGVSFSCNYGYDFVINHIKCFMGEDIDSLMRKDGQYIARRYCDYLM